MNSPSVTNEEVNDGFSTNVALAEEEESTDEVAEEESDKKVSPYPWHVAFIIGNKVCERFSYYGIVNILPIYLEEKIMYSKNDAKLAFHAFLFVCNVMPLIGAGLADQFLGKYKTILYLSCVYVVGIIINTVGSLTQYSSIPHSELRVLGLALIALGVGGVRPCVDAFAGDQFKLPEQKRDVLKFFSVFYMGINVGGLTADIVGPELKSLPCLGGQDCYPLAFGLPALVMVIATVIIIMGKPYYTIKPTDGVVSKILGILWKGLTSCCRKERQSHKHWLDPAKESYEVELVDEIKFLTGVNGILLLFTPIILFWSLHSQIMTTWSSQANHMAGLKPTQSLVINSVLILILIPIFELFIYPKLAKCGILVKPLERMSVGMFLAAFSFMISGILDLMLEANPDQPLHVTLQIPQYILLSIAEMMVNITGLVFTYNHASPPMKTILMACWYLNLAFGNLLTTIVFAFGDFETRSAGIFLFSGIMLLSSFIFSILAWRHVPRDVVMKAQDTTNQSDDFENSAIKCI